MSSINPRPIKRLLIANRGEIATRIIASARELDIETFAVYTDNDIGHIYNAAHAIRLRNPASYLDINELMSIVLQHDIDAVHPGYGFLSESAELASGMAENNVMVVGPGAANLQRTGDKLEARTLAVECNVPVLPALTEPTSRVDAVRLFGEKVGPPIMVKAVDGGGGRGIRLIRSMADLPSLVSRAIEESPSRKVFAEKAAIDNFRHVEVQIVGDGKGNIAHLWERECSIQRRYQKIVEIAPSTAADRSMVSPVVEAAVTMAKKIKYLSLGTFEFLLNLVTEEFYFLEINPRLQVEHTITESLCGIDIVKAQLRLSQGGSLAGCGFLRNGQDTLKPPAGHSIQLRITAEDPEKNYSLSIGKIQSFRFPTGNGIRVDTALVNGISTVIGADFDSVIAKLIVTAASWEDVVSKAKRALEDTAIEGIKTNISLLRAIVSHRNFAHRTCDTQWLESKHEELLAQSQQPSQQPDPFHGLANAQTIPPANATASNPSTSLRKNDAWTISLRPETTPNAETHPLHLQLTRIIRNDFPSNFAANILFVPKPGSAPSAYRLDLTSTTTASSAASSQHRQGIKTDASHIILPISGKLVEILVDVGDVVAKDDAVAVVKQMKMELEIRSHRAGVVTWVTEAEDGEDVAEGMLAVVVEDEKRQTKL
ncbi:hypothetical protein LTR62_000792 [Meristemomyces frigidus]|uniref:Pyruvate carboxylase n=1 Tax=Meristemomyces frigidus TaxID=1508187 RepID=A0AAN7TM99_9PEZI|nr:hypothetical protein LTR62_000792 [Meristemomyces frigidus]